MVVGLESAVVLQPVLWECPDQQCCRVLKPGLVSRDFDSDRALKNPPSCFTYSQDTVSI
jgi:hypothetical protein